MVEMKVGTLSFLPHILNCRLAVAHAQQHSAAQLTQLSAKGSVTIKLSSVCCIWCSLVGPLYVYVM